MTDKAMTLLQEFKQLDDVVHQDSIERIIRAFADKLEGEEIIKTCAEAIHQCHYHPVDWGTKEWRGMFERERGLAEAMAKAALAVVRERVGK